MKLMNFLPMGAAALLLAFAACTDEMTEVQSGELRRIVMTAFDFETEDGSRTNFQITSAGAEFSWAANDTVGIFPNEGAQAYFPMTSGAGTKSANFTGGGWALKDASTYAAYYPFIGDFYLNKNAIPVDYTGQVQMGDASTAHLGAYDYMAAAPSTPKNGNVSFAFKHLGALVQLKLTFPQATTLKSVTLTTESEAFAVNGKVDIMANTLDITPVTSTKEVTLEVKNIATTEANQAVTLYMMLPPIDLTGKTLKAVVKTNISTEEVTLESKNFQAGKAYALSGTLKDPNGGTVAGNGTYKDGVVSIATAGTMKKLLGDDYLKITSLKVVGPINGDDVYYLRKMLGGSEFSDADLGKLSTLDLSEASIVEGGEWYYDNGYKNYTTNNEIGEHMFTNCNNLKNIVLPKNITSIESWAFENSGSLIYVTIPDGLLEIGAEAFINCSALKNVAIPNSVTSIGEKAFYRCNALTEVILGNGVDWIKTETFAFCHNLTKVTIGNGLTYIGGAAFSQCTSLAELIIKDLSLWCNVEFVGNMSNPLLYGAKLYLNDTEITQLTIPEDIQVIKDYAFIGCKSITSVIIPDGVTSIGKMAFKDCNAVTKISISSSVSSINDSAFESCSTLTSVSIPEGIAELRHKAFKGCTSLTKVTIPSTLERMLSEVFSGCSIDTIYCYATTPPSYYSDTFKEGKKTEATLYVPARCGAVYKSSNWGYYFKNIVEMD